MTPVQRVVTGLAAAAMLLAQPAMAGPNRSGSHTDRAEKLNAVETAGVGVIGVITIVLVVLIFTGTDEASMPVSP